jgi:DNA-directed RNA polymerase subunit M/transcription elongation factor TFIIS
MLSSLLNWRAGSAKDSESSRPSQANHRSITGMTPVGPVLCSKGTYPMNNAQTQFIAVCPACSASLKVNFNKLGQHIACPQCQRTFVAGEASLPDNQRSGARPAVPSNQANDHVERVDTVCPHCNATLHVRRAYVGNDVRCKYCDEVFRVRVAAENQAKTEPDQPDQPDHRQQSLQAEQEQLYVAHNLLQADHDRLKTECTELGENLQRVTTELETIRAALGTVAPEEVGSLANERQSLSAEVHRLRDEIHVSLATQSERDQLVAERQRWVSELDLAHAERDMLIKQLRERDDRLEEARADHDRLHVERQTAMTEVDHLRAALAQSDDAAHNERNQLRREADDLRRELDLAEQSHRTELDRLNNELGALQETHRRLQDEHNLVQERHGPYDQSSFASETLRCERTTGQPPVLGIVSEESESQAKSSTTGILTSGGERSITSGELESLHAQVEELGQRLDESERLQREMAAVLEGLGIGCRPIRH